MELHLSEEFWIAADALAGHRMMQSPTQQQVNHNHHSTDFLIDFLRLLWRILLNQLVELFPHISTVITSIC